jgi:cold shock CspA family protein
LVERQLPKLKVVGSSPIARSLPVAVRPLDSRGDDVDGTMLFYNEEKDYGFIRTAEGERIAVHRASFVNGEAPVGRCAGLPVRLTPADTEDGRLATNVSIVVEADYGRARRRSSR